MAEIDDLSAAFEAERPRLLRLATRVLADAAEAKDVVQTSWMRLHQTENVDGTVVLNRPAWLTTVVTRLCLDRLRAQTPLPVDDLEPHLEGDTSAVAPDPADDVALADTVGRALHVVLNRLTPAERVAFVLHDTFSIEFATIAEILSTTPVAARKLASRARSKITGPPSAAGPPDHEVVDAFLAAARGGDLQRLVSLLAPDVVVAGDEEAVALGTPRQLNGSRDVAAMFNGAAKAALPTYVDDRPGAAWFHRGEVRVAFDFTIADGLITRIDFRADPQLLAATRRRDVTAPHGT